MRITHDTYDRLVVWDRPILLSGFILLAAGNCLYLGVFGAEESGVFRRLIAFALGGGLFWIALTKMPVLRFVFDRQSDRIWRTRWHLWKRIEDSMPLSQVTNIRQRADRFGNDAPVHYIELEYESANGEIRAEPLSDAATGRRHDEIIAQLKDWLTRPG